MAATICWIGIAAALFVYALRRATRERRTAPRITAGLALTAAATAKLFLFDLATLDGIFRVAAFIVAVGLVLLVSARLHPQPRGPVCRWVGEQTHNRTKSSILNEIYVCVAVGWIKRMATAAAVSPS